MLIKTLEKKKLIQIILLFIILLTILISYLYINNKTEIADKKEGKIDLIGSEENKNNIIENIYYISEDSNNNKFEISSKLGEVDATNPDLIKMIDVIGYIYLSNGKNVKIESKNAIYNNKTYDTIFDNDVRLSFEDNKVFSEKLELFFEKNKINVSEKVTFKNKNSNISADRVEIDLNTRVSKIFMDNNNDKVVAKYWD